MWTEKKRYDNEPVRESAHLFPHEKETFIAFTKEDGEAVIGTWEAPLIRRLLALPHFAPTRLLLEDGAVVYAEGKLPIGCLKITGVPRSSPSHAEVVARLREGAKAGVEPS